MTHPRLATRSASKPKLRSKTAKPLRRSSACLATAPRSSMKNGAANGPTAKATASSTRRPSANTPSSKALREWIDRTLVASPRRTRRCNDAQLRPPLRAMAATDRQPCAEYELRRNSTGPRALIGSDRQIWRFKEAQTRRSHRFAPLPEFSDALPRRSPHIASHASRKSLA